MRLCRVVRWASLREEAAGERGHGAALRAALAGEDTAVNAALYLLLRAADRFHAAHNRFPGTFAGCARRPCDAHPGAAHFCDERSSVKVQGVPGLAMCLTCCGQRQ